MSKHNLYCVSLYRCRQHMAQFVRVSRIQYAIAPKAIVRGNLSTEPEAMLVFVLT